MIVGIAHIAFSVTEIDRTIEFYTKVLGMKLQAKGREKNDTLGTAIFGTKWGINQQHADIAYAVIKIGDTNVEFIEYRDPKGQPYHKNPSIAGSAHLAFKVDDIEEMRKKLETAGVEFHSPINDFIKDGKIEWKWCYFRDPDGIILELVQKTK